MQGSPNYRKGPFALLAIAVTMLTLSLFFKDLAILKVGDIFKMQCLKLYYNIRHNRTPALFTTLLTYNNTVHAHNTRQLHDIHISGTRMTLAHKCFSKHLPKLLRIFPELVLLKIDTHSYSAFSRFTSTYYSNTVISV